ncbi:MAG: hypothetical protein U0703_06850 [Anaerolineae bacterium]
MIGRSWDSQWYQVRLMTGQGKAGVRAVSRHLDRPEPAGGDVAAADRAPIATIGSFALGSHVMVVSDAFGLAHRAGMTWIKVQHRFYVGQSAAEVAGQIQSAHQNGFRILLGVVGDRGQMGDFNSYIASYAAFVSDVAALNADAIEIWNEPNIDREWPAGTIYGANYIAARRVVYGDQGARAQHGRHQRRARADWLLRRLRLRHRRLQRRHLLQADGGGGRAELPRLRGLAPQRRHRLAAVVQRRPARRPPHLLPAKA